jgi:hypothetical protein
MLMWHYSCILDHAIIAMCYPLQKNNGKNYIFLFYNVEVVVLIIYIKKNVIVLIFYFFFL